MKHGADPYIQSKASTPMEMAIANGKMERIVALMEGMNLKYTF